jgi:flagellar export protein FliJ
MGGFVFDLQAVLDQRTQVERGRQLEVAALEAQRLAIEEEIRGYQIRIESTRDELRRALGAKRGEPGSADLLAARRQAAASLHLIARARQAALRLAGVLSRLERTRADLIRATVDRKAVEALRERRLRAWQTERAQRESAALDELNVMRSARRRGDADEEAA